MTTAVRPQGSFDDDVLHDPDLEAQLEERERKKATKKGAADDYDEIKWPEVVSAVRELLPEAQPWSVNQWRWVLR